MPPAAGGDDSVERPSRSRAHAIPLSAPRRAVRGSSLLPAGGRARRPERLSRRGIGARDSARARGVGGGKLRARPRHLREDRRAKPRAARGSLLPCGGLPNSPGPFRTPGLPGRIQGKLGPGGFPLRIPYPAKHRRRKRTPFHRPLQGDDRRRGIEKAALHHCLPLWAETIGEHGAGARARSRPRGRLLRPGPLSLLAEPDPRPPRREQNPAPGGGSKEWPTCGAPPSGEGG